MENLEWVPYNQREYFNWLCELVDNDEPGPTYFKLLDVLFNTEFSEKTAVLIPNDDNRIEDGLYLREEFTDEFDISNQVILTGPCSLLEMMIGLAKRIEDSFGMRSACEWFWEMMDNLYWMGFTDSDSWSNEDLYVTIEELLKRKYDRNGDGSLFPMKHAKRDMRKTEIWYQMSNYLIERYM